MAHWICSFEMHALSKLNMCVRSVLSLTAIRKEVRTHGATSQDVLSTCDVAAKKMHRSMPEWRLKTCMQLLGVKPPHISGAARASNIYVAIHKLQKQLLAVLQNLKEGLWKFPGPLRQELLQQLLCKAISDSDTPSEQPAAAGTYQWTTPTLRKPRKTLR